MKGIPHAVCYRLDCHRVASAVLRTPTTGQGLCLSRTCEKKQERQHRQQGNLQVILHSFFSYKMVIDDVLSWTVCVLGHLGWAAVAGLFGRRPWFSIVGAKISISFQTAKCFSLLF